MFDVLHLDGTDLTAWPYARRRTVLETLFANTPLTAPLTLCPSTTDPATAREWLGWTSSGLEGLCFKKLTEPYRPGARTWQKYKVRATADAIVGAVTGPAAAPGALLLGQYDDGGVLRYIGRTTSLARATAAALAGLLTPADGEHPWTGRRFTAAWGSRDVLDVTFVDPHLVVEVAVDVARDAAGRWRLPVQMHRARPDLPSRAVPPYGA
ncbi:ATP-dependent DNA ligase [Streptomyces sp. DSM 41013]